MKFKLLSLFFALAALNTWAQHEDYWTTQNTGFETPSRGASVISVANENVVWVRAHDGADTSNHIQEFTKTSDGGATWTAGTIDIDSPGSGIAMIHGLSADVAWLVAFPYAAGQDQGIFKTTDGGATWTKQESAAYSDPAAFANVVYFWDENVGVCQGDPVEGYFEIYTTDNGGDTWTRVPSADIPPPVAGEYGYTSQIFVTGDTVWFTTNKGRIFRSYDHGHTWQAFQSPIDDFGGSASSGEISFSDDLHGYLVNNEGLFWTSEDGGENWTIVFPGGDGIVMPGDVFAIPGTNVVITTSANSESTMGSSYSVNGGQDFYTMCDTDQHMDVQFVNNSVGWSGSFNSIDEDTGESVGGIFKYSGEPFASVQDLKEKGFWSYPNPVEDYYNMSANENITKVSIYNLLGQEVYNAEPNARAFQVDMSSLPKGTYIVTVNIGGNTGSIKVVK